MLFLGERAGLIDFYFACTDAYAYDLAICLNAWCFEPDGSYNITKGAGMVAAYREHRALSAAEIAALPTLARGAALRFALTRLVDWLNVPPGALVRPKDPAEYIAKLRFHQRIAGPHELGVAA
ncbi:Homoserine kinase (fragment) [Beijerinckiaceae bacterium RH AL1]